MTKIAEKPSTNGAAAATDCRASPARAPIEERYAGTSGSTHGVAKDTRQAANATPASLTPPPPGRGRSAPPCRYRAHRRLLQLPVRADVTCPTSPPAQAPPRHRSAARRRERPTPAG